MGAPRPHRPARHHSLDVHTSQRASHLVAALLKVANLDIQHASRRHTRSIAADDNYPKNDTPMTLGEK